MEEKMEQNLRICKCCIEDFYKNGFGVTSVCKECHTKRAKEGKQERKRLKQQAVDAINARHLRLSDFTPRELINRLKELGYTGTLKYTKTEIIDIEKFE